MFVGHSAGGCRNNLALFATNPQYLLTVFDEDGSGGGGGSESSSSSDEDGGPAAEKVRKRFGDTTCLTSCVSVTLFR